MVEVGREPGCAVVELAHFLAVFGHLFGVEFDGGLIRIGDEFGFEEEVQGCGGFERLHFVMEGLDFVEVIGPGEANDALSDAGAGGHGGGLSHGGAVLLDGGNFGDDVGLIDAVEGTAAFPGSAGCVGGFAFEGELYQHGAGADVEGFSSEEFLGDAGNAALDFEAVLFKDDGEVFGGFNFLD